MALAFTFGHLNFKYLFQLSQHSIVSGLPLVNILESKLSGKLEIVYSYVCGPIQTETLRGSRYFVIFIYDWTRKTCSYLLKRKSEVLEVFKRFKHMVERQSYRKLKVLRIDEGGEDNHEMTPHNTPEHNGTVERKNRTILNMVRCMLKSKEMPQFLWGEVVLTTTYILNRTPTKRLKNITPEEAWSTIKPNVKHLGVFGSICYKQIPDQLRRKLDDKGVPLILIGYHATGGYKLYNPVTGQTTISRDMIIDEDIVWDWKSINKYDPIEEKSTDQGGNLTRFSRTSQLPSHMKDYDLFYEATVTSEGNLVHYALVAEAEPVTFEQVASNNKWLKATQEEIDSIEKNQTWELAKLPANKRPIDFKEILLDIRSSWLQRDFYKRLDYGEVYAPVARMETMRLVVALANQLGWSLHQLDVKATFLNGRLEEEQGMVYRLKKALYELKQAPRAWNQRIDQFMDNIGFEKCASEHGVYVQNSQREGRVERLIMCLYMDDMLAIGSNEVLIQNFKLHMLSKFEMSDLGKLNYFLGIEFAETEKGIVMHQSCYAKEMLKKVEMQKCNAANTPVELDLRLETDLEEEVVDATFYRSMVGSLRYSCNTRPDVSYSVGLEKHKRLFVLSWKFTNIIEFNQGTSLKLLKQSLLKKQQSAHAHQNWELATSAKAHTAFSILLITSVYSFFLDKDLKQKTDAYSLLSRVAFAIMSLGLSRLSQLGFEVDLLYFFCGLLTVQLMKIKPWLVTVGGAFSYSLILLRSNLDLQPRSGYHGLQHQDHVVLEIGSHSQPQGTNNSVTQGTVSPQESGTGRAPPENIYGTKECFMGCIEALEKENGSVIRAISMHVDEYLKAYLPSDDHSLGSVLHRDDNIFVDSLLSGMVSKLRKSVEKMVSDGFEEECLHVYSNWRREFLKESLWTLGLQVQELHGEDINKWEKIERLIKAMNIAARILFPNEKRLFDRVFSGSIRNGEFHFRELCTELVTGLLNSALALATWSHFMRFTLLWLIQDFEQFTTLSNTAVHLIRQRLSIYEILDKVSRFSLGELSSAVPTYRLIELLESSSEAYSKNYENPSLGYISIMMVLRFIEAQTERRFIEVETKWNRIFDDHWHYKSRAKIQENLMLYLRSSWNKIMDLLKVDINQSEPSVVAELMKDNLYCFNEHFDETCYIESAWSVSDEVLREQIIESVENMLCPVYASFICTFEEIVGKHAYKYIKYEMFEVQDRLNKLFLLRE
ncbi:hypothetical protein V8G54_036744 [Vigna mungo]|uniref:Integrase catalytic domain-containing protein n=1 Tax=Vigna mungo TaxID=3915 RepID=A0AAQ3MHZ1_VIGMU